MGGTRVIGLTGGIASGKSVVASMLRELGAPIVDADVLARDVVAPGGAAYDDVLRAFGNGILEDGGAAPRKIDRKKLGAIVFADGERRRTLNALTHPRIAQAAQAAIAAHAARGAKVVIYDAALIVENGLQKALDGLIVVASSEATQLARIVARDALSPADARARLAAQLPLADKLAAATHVVHNDGALADTRAQVEKIWKELTA